MAETLGVVSGIIAVADLTYKVLRYLKSVRDAGKDIQDFNREAPNFAELLTSLAVNVVHSGGQDGDPWFESVQSLQRGPMQQYQAAMETLKEKVTPGTGLREKFTQYITWKFVKEEIKEILGKMERLKSLIVVALQKDHFKLSEAIHSITSKIKDDTAVIQATGEHHTNELAALKREAQKQSVLSSAILQDTSHIRELRAAARLAVEAEQKAQILGWLSKNHDHFKDQHDNMCRFKEGTGMWLLDDPKFKEWRDGTNDKLFCVGMPGAGKTVMTAMIIRHVFEASRVSDGHAAVAFLYLRYDLQDTQSFKLLLRSLIWQLITQLAKAPASIDEEYRGRSDPKYKRKSPQKLLQAAADCFSCVYFVIDALDEAEIGRTQDLVLTIRSLQDTQIKLFTTSRFIPEIQALFEDKQSIEIRGSDDDIKSYATDRLSELPRCVQASHALQEEIVQAIIASTQGMFLLSKLHIDSLKDKRTIKAMRSALKTLPSGSSAYDTAYAWAMKRISDQSESDYTLAQRVLTWLLYAMRPINAIELETALAVELGARNFDPDNVVTIVELLSLCAGLVVQHEESKTVTFVHYTTQQYFSRNPDHLPRNPHRALSNVCVSYLGIDDFMAAGYKEDGDDKRLSSHTYRSPFVKYAAAHWEDHSTAALPFRNDDEKSQTLALELRLLRHDELMESYLTARGEWSIAQHSLYDVHKFMFDRKTGMQYAAAKGKVEQVSLLLKDGFDPNESKYGTTALIEASRGHHDRVVRLLIEAKANIDFKAEGSKHTALTVALGMPGSLFDRSLSRPFQKDYHASTRAPEPTVHLLLEAGADPEHIVEDFGKLTPLMHASEYGMESIVAGLCRAGADVNRRGGDYSDEGQTALHIAAANGHESIVKHLLQLGCDPDGTHNRDRSPAVYAAEREHWTIVELLLDTPAVDLARTTPNGMTVLELACRSRHCPDALIKRLLLVTSPDRVNATGRPLIRAARANREARVNMLLEAGVDPHLTDQKGHTALHVVSRLRLINSQHAQIAITQALLGANVGVDTRGRDGVTTLMLASKTGQCELLKVLLDRGANVLSRDNRGWTPLTYAAEKGHASTIRILVNAGADVNMASESGITAVMSAAEHGCLDAATILIEAGAEVNAQMGNGTSALILSAAGGHKDLTRLLISSGADANVPNEKGETALIGVMRYEMKQMQRGMLEEGIRDFLPMLLEAGVDVNHSTDDGDTALLLATDPEYPRPDDANLLLEAGADPSQDGLSSWNRISQMDIQLLESLLKACADPNEDNEYGMTALMRVSRMGDQVDKLKMLLRHGASPNIVNKKGETALTLAIDRLDCDLGIDTVKELLDAGANPNHQDAAGESVLFHLLSRNCRSDTGCERVLKALIDAGGNIHAINRDRETLLMRSLRRPGLGLTKLLLAAGADPQGSDEGGRNAIMLASMGAGDEGAAVRLLLDSGADPNQRDYCGDNALMLAARSYPCPMTLRMLLSAGTDPHERDANGRTLLMLVASNKWISVSHTGNPGILGNVLKMIPALIEAGFDVDSRDKYGNTALMYAADHSELVHSLFEAGANPNLANNLGQTALIQCCLREEWDLKKMKGVTADTKRRSEQDVEAVSRILGVPGISLDHKSNGGSTALMCAERVRNKEIVRLIREEIQRREHSVKTH